MQEVYYDPKYYAYMYYADTHASNTSGNIDMWEPLGAHASAESVKFILDWEKYETTPYDDGFGNCTVGFGHLIGGACTQNINDDYKGKDFWVYYNLFHEDLHQAEAGVRSAFQGLDNHYYPGSSGYPLGGKAPINQSQFDALVDFSYQMGAGNVANLINNHLISSSNGVPFRDDDAFRTALTVTFSDASGIGVRRKQEVEIFFNGNYNSAH